MHVVCDRCQTHYDFEDALVSERGTTVKCTNCEHQFKIYRPAGLEPASGWTLQKADGTTVSFESLGVLQRWIANGEVERTDLLSRGGGEWKPLGVIAELLPFFAATEGESRTTKMPTADVILAQRAHGRGNRAITPAEVPTSQMRTPSKPPVRTTGASDPSAWSLGPAGAGLPPKGFPMQTGPAIGPPPVSLGKGVPQLPPLPGPAAQPLVPSQRPPTKGSARRGPGDVTERLDALSPERLRAMGLASDGTPAPTRRGSLVLGVLLGVVLATGLGALALWKAGLLGGANANAIASASASASANNAALEAAHARLVLARALIAEGNVREARVQIDAVLAAHPTHAEALALHATLPSASVEATATTSAAPSAVPSAAPSAAVPAPSTSAPSTPSAPTGDDDGGRAGRNAGSGSGGSGSGSSGGSLAGRSYDSLIAEGERALDRGQRDRARSAFMAALVQRPDGSEATTGLGFVELDGGSPGVALSHFRRALSINPRYSEAMLGVGEAYRRQGNNAEALRAYRDYLRANPGGSRASFVERQITALEGHAGAGGGAPGEGANGSNGASGTANGVPSP